jgi:hypothetical protein
MTVQGYFVILHIPHKKFWASRELLHGKKRCLIKIIDRDIKGRKSNPHKELKYHRFLLCLQVFLLLLYYCIFGATIAYIHSL